MSRGRGFAAAVAAALALVALSSALAAPTQARRQDLASRAADQPACCTVQLHLPNTYSLLLNTVVSPPTAYNLSAPGVWSGPGYRLNKPGSAPKPTSIKWWVKTDHVSTTAEAAAKAFAIDPTIFTVVKSGGPVEIPHLVGGSQVGTIAGFSTLLQSSQATLNAQFQGLLAFPIGVPSPISKSASRSEYFVVVRYLVRAPASDRYVVGDANTPAPDWNAQQIQAALSSVQMVGSLPPAQFTTTVRRVSSGCCRAVVRGSVKDSLGHPVAGAKVTLSRDLPQTEAQKKHHSKVKTKIVSDTVSAANGTYAVRVPKIAPKGVAYHVQVQLAHSALAHPVKLG
jgi:hypothetical protein